MLLRRPHDLAGLFRDGRARAGWTQSQLAETVGVSRQWISQVETGKTSVEFDLVLAVLQALGYCVQVDLSAGTANDRPAGSVHESTQRSPLTRNGEPLGTQRTKRTRRNR